MVTEYAKTLGNCVRLAPGEPVDVPTMSCNRAVVNMRIPEFFEAEELGVAPARSCKRCRGCKDCSYRGAMMSRDKEMVVRRVENMLKYDPEARRVTVSYPWTADVSN